MARKANPSWRHRQALDALYEVISLADAEAPMIRNGILRPAADGPQAGYFRETARSNDECHWLDASAVSERYPGVVAPHGALLVETGGAVEIPLLVDSILSAVLRTGGEIRLGCSLTTFSEQTDRVEAVLTASSEERTSCHRLLLACGAGFRSLRALDGLGLHAVKGQAIDVRVDHVLSLLPHLSGAGYVAWSGDIATVGSSFEHRFEDPTPDPKIGAGLLSRATRMLPALAGAEIVAYRAGIRVTKVGRRLPAVGPLPGHQRVWLFTALGSRGLLMAPLIGSRLPDFLAGEQQIPNEIRL
jgi:glycine oxidase